MALDKSLQALRFDVRLQEFNLRHGVVKEAELKQHIQELPDLANNAVPIDLEDNDNQSNGAAH